MWKKVLIIDDEREFGNTLAERLLLRNYDAKAIDNVEEAIIEANQIKPDVVLLDFKMPGGFGINTLKAIKDISPATKVLMITGHSSQSSIQEFISHGAEDYLIKPVDIEELVTKIEEVIKK